MNNKITKEEYNELYQEYRDLKTISFKICDKKLDSIEKYNYLLSAYSTHSFTLGVDKIYVTYNYPTYNYKVCFSFPAYLAYEDEIQEYHIDEMDFHVFKTDK